jgi:hypothetical protein
MEWIFRLLSYFEISILLRQIEVLPIGQGLAAKALIGAQSPDGRGERRDRPGRPNAGPENPFKG